MRNNACNIRFAGDSANQSERVRARENQHVNIDRCGNNALCAAYVVLQSYFICLLGIEN